ncbi:hypothetical protein Lesp02_75670 [Lentzea sp. NBRC 105346]|nr:hypothetical protein Lesp02_75670 [Lentzea sp. NBRC 105346]
MWAPGFASLAGALAGLLVELAAFQLGLFIGAVLFGLRVNHVIIGVGGVIKEWTSARRRVVLRSIPILTAVGITGERTPVRGRMVGAGIFSAVIATATAGTLWLTTGADVGKGLALGATATLLNELIPVRRPGNTSAGWYVFALPRLAGRELAELEAAPHVTRAIEAFNAGDLDTAGRIADELATTHPELVTVIGLKVTTMSVSGRHAEALGLITTLAGRDGLTPREIAFVMATTAGLAALAVESGQLPAEIGIATARSTLTGALEAGYPTYRAHGTLALIALLEGDTDTAIELGNRAAESSHQAVDRADDLTTVAKAHMAAGNNKKAREIMAEAHALAGWLPRVATTNARLSIS